MFAALNLQTINLKLSWIDPSLEWKVKPSMSRRSTLRRLGRVLGFAMKDRAFKELVSTERLTWRLEEVSFV